MSEPVIITSYSIENDKAFNDAINKSLALVGDLSTPFKLIRNDFYKSEKAIFKLKSSGAYPDFGGFSPDKAVRFQGKWLKRKDAYRLAKIRKYGFDYPLLKGSGKLMDSVTKEKAEGSYSKIKPTYLVIGTTIDYGKYHQSDKARTKIPLRKFLFIGPEGNVQSVPATTGRLERWLKILDSYTMKKIKIGTFK